MPKYTASLERVTALATIIVLLFSANVLADSSFSANKPPRSSTHKGKRLSVGINAAANAISSFDSADVAEEVLLAEGRAPVGRETGPTSSSENIITALEELHLSLIAASERRIADSADHAWAAFLSVPLQASRIGSGVTGLASQLLLSAGRIHEAKSILRASNPCSWVHETWLTAAMLADEAGDLPLANLLYDLVRVRTARQLGLHSNLTHSASRIPLEGVPLNASIRASIGIASEFQFRETASRTSIYQTSDRYACHLAARQALQLNLRESTQSCTVKHGNIVGKLLNCVVSGDQLVRAALERMLASLMVDPSTHLSPDDTHSASDRSLTLNMKDEKQEHSSMLWHRSHEYMAALSDMAGQMAARTAFFAGRVPSSTFLHSDIGNSTDDNMHSNSNGETDSTEYVSAQLLIGYGGAAMQPHGGDANASAVLVSFLRNAYQLAEIESPHDSLLDNAIERILQHVPVTTESLDEQLGNIVANVAAAGSNRFVRSAAYSLNMLDTGDTSQFHRTLLRHIPLFANVTATWLDMLASSFPQLDILPAAAHGHTHVYEDTRSVLLTRELDWALARSFAEEYRWQQAQIHLRQAIDAGMQLFDKDHIQRARDLIALSFTQVQSKTKADCVTALQNLKKARNIIMKTLGANAARHSLSFQYADLLSGHASICCKQPIKALRMYERTAQYSTSPIIAAEASSLVAFVKENLEMEQRITVCRGLSEGSRLFTLISTQLNSSVDLFSHVRRPFRGWIAYASCLSKVLEAISVSVSPEYSAAGNAWSAVPLSQKQKNQIFQTFQVRTTWLSLYRSAVPHMTLAQGAMCTLQYLVLHYALNAFPPALASHALMIRDSFLPHNAIDLSGVFGPDSAAESMVSNSEQRELAWPVESSPSIRDHFLSIGLHLNEHDAYPHDAQFRAHATADSHLMVSIESYQFCRHAMETFQSLKDKRYTNVNALLHPNTISLLLKAVRHISAGIMLTTRRIQWAVATNHSVEHWYGLSQSMYGAPAGSGRTTGALAMSTPTTCLGSLVSNLAAYYNNLHDVLIRMLIYLGAVERASSKAVHWHYMNHPNIQFRYLAAVVRTGALQAYQMYEQMKELKSNLTSLPPLAQRSAIQETIPLPADIHSVKDILTLLNGG